MTRTLLVAGCGLFALVATAGCSTHRGCRTCDRPARVVPTPAGASQPAGPTKEARYGGQVRCPVTGEELGSMGEPVAATVGGRTVYVCCRGCVKRAEADPTNTLAAVEAERAAR